MSNLLLSVTPRTHEKLNNGAHYNNLIVYVLPILGNSDHYKFEKTLVETSAGKIPRTYVLKIQAHSIKGFFFFKRQLKEKGVFFSHNTSEKIITVDPINNPEFLSQVGKWEKSFGSSVNIPGQALGPNLRYGNLESCKNIKEELSFLAKNLNRKGLAIGGEKIIRCAYNMLRTDGYVIYSTVSEEVEKELISFLLFLGYKKSKIQKHYLSRKGSKFFPIKLFLRNGKKRNIITPHPFP